MSKEKRFIYSIYAIFLMAYLTLTSTTPILLTISVSSHIPLTHLQLGVSILFLLFSCSSVLLGPVSDFLGRRNVLLATQCTGIIGLIVCAFSDSFVSISIGLAIIGLGTGAYSVVARSIVNHTINDHHTLFKIYSTFSLLIMLGPIVSTKLSIAIANSLGWHVVYIALFILEIFVLLATYLNIHEPDKAFKPSRISVSGIAQQFIYCAKQPVFVKNAILVGLFYL
ncbi:MFS transporter [Piscirickettsia litoralis]|uniref:Major facilitator superfamily (MFS) profile domain-containing protein n=1 Tax=Piscirickettsia litoralis TaxID=1891921 RepID=A0ABX2ZZX4_9GAMM|nr:MFS transporter [Piscirickettsia litoralis]ODN41775.1 hypothetical protein BGC07_00740 [Piscirickettsia litoralis]